MKKTAHLQAASLVICAWVPVADAQQTANTLNPAISMILQGQYANYNQDPETYALPGFMLGGEAGLADAGFGLGHGELVMSSNIDDMYYGKLTLAIAEHEGATEVELEEAYIETFGLGSGFTARAGRYFSAFGYLNNQHTHAWDFIDAPLVYRAMFGDQLIDDGIQLRWLAPTDFYLQVGIELGRGERFPAGGASNEGRGSRVLFVELGGDIGVSHGWQLGLSHWSAEIADRQGGGDIHAGGVAEIPSYTGDSDITALDAVWKWAPNGNYAQRNLTLQFEYFKRDEDGNIELINSGPPLETTSYLGEQKGWYAQAVYQFMPQWRAGVRYDRLEADNTGSDAIVLAEAGLDDGGHTPMRSSVMFDYARNEFSLLRLQFNRDESSATTDNQVFFQYVVSLGAHGAHQF